MYLDTGRKANINLYEVNSCTLFQVKLNIMLQAKVRSKCTLSEGLTTSVEAAMLHIKLSPP